MNCLSVSFRTADINIRKQLAFDSEQKRAVISALTAEGGECVVLCTCNRTEVYCLADTERALNVLSEVSGLAKTKLTPYVSVYCGKKAEEHLFRLACGMESMIIGEDEILRQIRDAYRQSTELKGAGFEVHTVFQSAVTCAKRVKTETKISTAPVSAATIAANEASAFAESVNVLVIGATGSIGSSVLKNLIAHKNVTAAMTIRRHGGKLVIPDIPEAEIIEYTDRYEVLDRFDCVISATSSPHYVLTKERMESSLKTEKKRLFIDLAVPPDIESSAAETEGVTLLDIDHFAALAKQNNDTRMTSAREAESIIAEELDTMRKKLLFHDFLPDMEKAASYIDSLSAEKIIYLLRDELDCAGLKRILDILRKAVDGG